MRSRVSLLAAGIVSYSYTKLRRDFPWRHKITAYRIMIAEFMLQRTRADQVAPVYASFIREFPDVKRLSEASIEAISAYTSHLGIHSRAHYFKDAAVFIVKRHNGRIPPHREDLLEIPGVGEYVAGAILAAAFRKSDWVIDSNIARFLNRLHGLSLKGEIRRRKIVIQKSKELFQYTDPRKLLFSVLDFTALVCTPRTPHCPSCPLRRHCRYNAKALPHN